MDREAREERDRSFHEMLREKYQANRGLRGAGLGFLLENLVAQRREREAPPAQEERERG